MGRARGRPRAADDAKGVITIPLAGTWRDAATKRKALHPKNTLVEMQSLSFAELKHKMPKFAFDHGRIVEAYLAQYHSTEGLPASNIANACPISSHLESNETKRRSGKPKRTGFFGHARRHT